MIRVLQDTNVVLDALLDRAPWNNDAAAIWQAHLDQKLAAHISATSMTDVFYVARRHAGIDRALLAIRTCLDQLFVIAVGDNELRVAAALEGRDFEDNVQVACAAALDLDAIVTRDPAGFRLIAVGIVGPRDLLLRVAAES